MKKVSLFFTITAVASLLCSLCTQATFDNPIDPKNPAHVADSLMEDKDNNGIADYYDHLTPVVTDKVPPIITFIGGDTVVVPLNDPKGILAKDSVTARDNVDGVITGSVTTTGGTVFTSQCSTYTITYSVSDKAGNQAQPKTRVIIVDCRGPVITLRGRNPDSIAVGKKYTDPGATALDNIDGVVTVTPPPAANTAKEGVDTLVYSAVDKVGNVSKVPRILVVFTPAVIDSVPPVITLIGSKDTTIIKGATWIEPGYRASDNIDSNITSSVVVTNPLNTNITGTYTISYNVSDKSGNAAATQTRKVTVIKSIVGPDVTPPVITLKGRNPDTVKVGPGTYTDPGDTAIDDVDGNVTANVVVTELYNKLLPISTSSAGAYVLVYTVSDKAGNKASATRYVYVVGASNDKTPPLITLANAGVICSVGVGKKFIDPGYSAYDTNDGIITNKVKRDFKNSQGTAVDSATFTGMIGRYTITYSVSDAAGNPATPQNRTVAVVDTTKPPPGNLLQKYSAPLSTPLPTVTTTSTSSGGAVTYSTITTDGTGAPNMSSVKSFTFKWRNETTSQGLDNFSFTYTNGSYFSLKDNNIMTNTFSQANPGLTFTNSGPGSGISGLDGTYYITATAAQCVWVRTDGSFAIVFKP